MELIGNAIILVIGIVLGVLFSKNLKRFWLKFKSDPAATIQNEIDELKKLADSYRK